MTDVKIFELLELLDSLKHLKRTGWLHFQVPEPETVASHMYRMAVLAMALKAKHGPDAKIDELKVLKMALIHDIAEAVCGDITPRCGISSEKKFELEQKGLKQIANCVPDSIGSEWMELWLEYSDASTPEAVIVKQLDKLDVLAQALHYELKYGIDLGEFFNATLHSFTTPPFVEWSSEIRRKREEHSPYGMKKKEG